MRIMFGKDYVKEIIAIDATPSWKEGESTADNPGMYSISFFEPYRNENKYDYVGTYNLDGTKETYEKAKANFEMICEKLLTQGWCRDTDFENFEWY